MSDTRYREIVVGDAHVAFQADGREYSYPRVRLPKSFTGWLIEGRRAMYALLEGRGHAPFFGSHLPVVVTCARGTDFPINTGNKGVGLAPVPQRVDHYCELYRATFERSRQAAWESSLADRLAAVRSFIASDDISDEMLLSLEIFERGTFTNLCDFPLATLHYTGDGPVYRSFQINAVVQIVPPEHPAYRFAFWSRQLFEYDAFHITQRHFPYAYVFYPVEVRDKTPYPRREGAQAEAQPQPWAEMTLLWDGEVLDLLRRAPQFVQRFIIRITEERARQRGYASVTVQLFNEVRAQYMEKRAQAAALRESRHGSGDA
ncbi:MAG: PCP reductase family protein [Candidatus Lambdaproteobacteria bacterium]|nr:PCP reductase family protein [Candidatus Lambdaproteobacteria bacterium]